MVKDNELNRDAVVEEILLRIKDTFNVTSDKQDNYIKNLTSNTFSEFSIMTGSSTLKENYLFVIEGVVEKRYVRRGSQGLKSEDSDGYRVSYRESDLDFEEYIDLLRTEYEIKVGAWVLPSVRFY